MLRRVVRVLTRGSLCAGAFIPKWYHFRCARITHGGVDTPSERPPLGEGALFIGRLEPDTGLMSTVEALRLLKAQHGLELPLQVCGDGSQRAAAAAGAASAGLAVTFHGQVADVSPYLQQARFAFVSGFLGMLEAMALGRAVLAVYDNPLKEDYLRLFPGAQHVAIAGSPEELAGQLAALLADPEGLAGRLEQAYRFAQTQTWARVADLYRSLYASAGRAEEPSSS